MEMDSKGWPYDPLNGLTVLKGDMDKWYDADPLIQEHQAKMHYTQELIDTLKEISDELNIPYQFVADCSSRGFNKKFQNYSFVPKIEITKIKYTS